MDARAGMESRDGAASELWKSVLARDSAADGLFVYGVRSTGIYCRPVCPSRRPAARHVVFFAGPEQARAAGFRACLRCKPDLDAAPGQARSAAVGRAAQYLASHPEQRAGLVGLGRRTGLERLALLRRFQQTLRVTPGEFARACRVERLREELAGDLAGSVTDAIYAAGFGSSSRVYERSSAELGMTPGELRRGGSGLVIHYITAESALGWMLVAATELGVCAILFGEDIVGLEKDLQRRFRNAELVRAVAVQAGVEASTELDPTSGWLREAVAFVASQVSEAPTARSFPLHIRATAFQHRVWKALQAIPRGETRSYSDIADAIGRPSAVRAVGAAIGANPLAVAVPCHRVLGKDGSLTGYHWGLERKRRLLAAERAEDAEV